MKRFVIIFGACVFINSCQTYEMFDQLIIPALKKERIRVCNTQYSHYGHTQCVDKAWCYKCD